VKKIEILAKKKIGKKIEILAKRISVKKSKFWQKEFW